MLFWFIAFLLLILVLANPTARNILMGFTFWSVAICGVSVAGWVLYRWDGARAIVTALVALVIALILRAWIREERQLRQDTGKAGPRPPIERA